MREEPGLEGWWRDLQTAITHVCNLRDAIYSGWAINSFGGEVSPRVLY